MMKKIVLRIFLLGFLVAASVSLAAADKIFLKSGKVYEGKVIGKSEQRYLFALDLGGEKMAISFFVEDVDKVEMSKDSVGKQIPYLKEVEDFKVAMKEDSSKVYEVSLYKKNPNAAAGAFTDAEAQNVLTPEEFDYYTKFNDVTKKFVDKISAVDALYKNLTTATKDEFNSAKQYMDELYFQVNALVVPKAFKQCHTLYLESVKATYLVFNALEQGLLDEAGEQIKISQDSKEDSLLLFRQILENKFIAKQASVKLGSVPAGNTTIGAAGNATAVQAKNVTTAQTGNTTAVQAL